MKTTCLNKTQRFWKVGVPLLVLFAVFSFSSARAVTNFGVANNFLIDPGAYSASWDFFSTTSGSQGAAQATAGPNPLTGTDASTTILVPFTSPPGGLLPPAGPGAGDRYYVHDGAFSWSETATSVNPVDYIRISYALVGSGFGGTAPFPIGPNLSVGNTPLGGGAYNDPAGGNRIFYFDYVLDSPQTSVTATFGDVPAPFSSFRSVNGVEIVGMTLQPGAVPEPSRALLVAGGLAIGLFRRRRSA
ncbi:MAG: PEP-CTERM sorting domain-containing protein [Verrucomicrobiota bacterium]